MSRTWPSRGPADLAVTVSLPRWLYRSALVAVGLLLLVSIPFAVLVAVVSGGAGNSAEGRIVLGPVGTSAEPGPLIVQVEVSVAPGSKQEYRNEGWSLLYDDGLITHGRVISGPDVFPAGENSRVLVEFPEREGGRRVAIRYDPGGEMGVSFPLPLVID